MPVLRQTDLITIGGEMIGEIAVTVGPVGITDVVVTIHSDNFTLVNMVHEPISESGKNDTVVLLSGTPRVFK